MVPNRGSKATLAVGATVLLALASVGCAADDPGSESVSPTTGVGTTSANLPAACDDGPVELGEDGAAVTGLVESAAEQDDLTSVLYRVTRGDEVVASGAVGESMTGIPAETTMHFRNGNVAFAYLGTLLLLMAKSGEVALDDPVGRWLPDLDLPAADEVTLEMLARSTSGYPDYVPDPAFQDTFLTDPFGAFGPQDLIHFALVTEPWYPPGTSWSYAHTNYVILGEALAAAGGQPLGDLLTERVIEPMGLGSTAPALTPGVPEPVLHTYSTERDVFEDTTFWNPSWQTAPGSVLTTTICDMAASARAVGTGALLTDASLVEMLDPITTTLPPAPSCPETVCRPMTDERYYALGVIVMGGWIVQTPLFGGAGAVHAYLPEADLAVAVVAVTGQGSEVGRNHSTGIWRSIATELAPDHVPQV